MPNYKCECATVFGGDDAQRDRDIHMDSCEFVKIRKEKDALLLQVDGLKKDLAHWKDCHGATADKLEESNRLYDECLKIAERFMSYSPHTPSDLDRGWKGAAGRIAEEILNLKQTVKGSHEVGHCMKCSKVLRSAYGWCAECYKAFGGQELLKRLCLTCGAPRPCASHDETMKRNHE